ncbi:MAG: prephenate dehydrogenase/arogenate dehydrogenase family protein [Acidobacteria bacterium]|nr:prephenate dehydrogenase/arogenate dehydrogenase family protein [Acidobacteriota bacterium]
MEGAFHRAAIVGVGLIGGSLGLALKKTWPHRHVRGIGRDGARLEAARRMGAIDEWTTDVEKGVRDRDLVILATPVEHILSAFDTVGVLLAPGTLLTDVGSTKRQICSRAWDRLPGSVEFIGGHPVAGREVTGVQHSLSDLFVGAPYVLCPRGSTHTPHLERLLNLVKSIGARPHVMTPEDHDLAIAWVSHLPQLLSTTLALSVAGRGTEISGSGLRDMLRLAGSSHAVWRSVIATNRDMIDQALQGFIEELRAMRRKIAAGSLQGDFEYAARIYERLKSAR